MSTQQQGVPHHEHDLIYLLLSVPNCRKWHRRRRIWRLNFYVTCPLVIVQILSIAPLFLQRRRWFPIHNIVEMQTIRCVIKSRHGRHDVMDVCTVVAWTSTDAVGQRSGHVGGHTFTQEIERRTFCGPKSKTGWKRDTKRTESWEKRNIRKGTKHRERECGHLDDSKDVRLKGRK